MLPPQNLPSPHTGVAFVSTVHQDTYPAIDPAKADLSGKVVLITGASKGIGKAISVAYAKAGVSGLALLARSKTGLESTERACLEAQRSGQSLKVARIAVDITRSDDVSAALKEVEGTFGRLDIVINNAGLMETPSVLGDTDPSEWWDVWTVNIKGIFNITRSSLPLLISCGGLKTIVNLTSIGAHLLSPHLSAYQSTKFAVLRLTEIICAGYEAQGILSYSIHPGAVLTDMADQMIEGDDWSHIFNDTPELAADAIVYYTKERRDWLAGRYICAPWDVDEFIAKKQEIVDGDKLKVRMVI